jgi:hypothetical protein
MHGCCGHDERCVGVCVLTSGACARATTALTVVEAVSDALKLVESEAARLVMTASETSVRDSNTTAYSSTVRLAAIALWHDERLAELRALATLLKVRASFWL